MRILLLNDVIHDKVVAGLGECRQTEMKSGKCGRAKHANGAASAPAPSAKTRLRRKVSSSARRRAAHRPCFQATAPVLRNAAISSAP